MWGLRSFAISALWLRVTRTAALSTTSSDRCLNDRYAAIVTYDGGDYSGWQIQTTNRCVQGVLNEVLGDMWEHPVKVLGASRTDKGVHARGQVIHFDLPISLSETEVAESLHKVNRMLPDDLKLKRLSRAPEGLLEIQIAQGLPWHAGENAVAKHYSYIFSASDHMIDPMSIRYRANLYNYKATQLMNLESFQEALNVFKGTHDFKAFGNRLDVRARVHEAYSGETFSSVRTVLSAEISEIQVLNNNSPSPSSSSSSFGITCGTFYRVDIIVNGALYKMLRNMIAGCIEVSYGTMQLNELQSLLGNIPSLENIPSLGNTPSLGNIPSPINSFALKNIPTVFPSRAENRLVTAPACGLCLEEVFYNEKVFS